MHVFIRNLDDLGSAIRERRRRLGLRQEELAAKVGVTRQWIAAIERGKPRAAVGLVLATLDALGLTVALGDAPPAPPEDPATDIDAVIRRAKR